MELSAELTKKIENAISGNRLVGNMVFSDDEYEALLEYTRSFSVPYSRGIGTYLRGNDSIHFVTLVEIAKRWKRIDDDENDESGFWEYVFKTLLGIDGYDQKLYSAYTDIIRGLGGSGKVLVATKGHRFWATLMMHAFAPIKSIYAFLDLADNIYKNDLEFNYTEGDQSICDITTIRFCEILESAVGNDKTVSIGTNAYGVKIGLRTLAQNSATQNDFVALLDKSFDGINKLYHRQTFKPEGCFEKIIQDWWQSKSRPRPPRGRRLPAVSKQNITAKFIREDDAVSLVIPPIRLNSGAASVVWLSIYTGNNCEQRVSEALFTKVGELTITTKEKEINLNELFKGDEPIKLRIEITENGIVIFDKSIEKDFLLFDGENEVLSQINKTSNYFVYARNLEKLKVPSDISTYASNLYNVYPKVGETLTGAARQVLFVSRTHTTDNKGEICLLGSLPDCEWRFDDMSYLVFSEQIRILLPDGASMNGLELAVDAKRTLLSDMKGWQQDGYRLFDITDYIPKLEPTAVSVFSHIKNKQLLSSNVVAFPSLRVVFSKAVFYGNDEKKLTISVDDDSKVLTWDNAQNEVVYPLNDGELIIKIPYTRWRVDDKEWLNESFNKRVWYKNHFHNGSLLEVDSAVDMENATMFALCDGQTVAVERNKTNGKFELGRYLFANENKREIMFFIPHSGKLIELFVVATEEHFIDVPLAYLGGKLFWQPNGNFVGDETRKFQIEFIRKGSEPLTASDLAFSDDVIEGLDEGIYKIKVSSQEKGLFKKETKVFYEGGIVVGRKEKFRFENKHIKITSASGELSTGESAQMYWKPLDCAYYIDGIEYIERGEQGFYIGRLFTLDRFSKKIYLDNMKNQFNSYDRINPVQLHMVTNNTFELIAGYNKDNENDFLGELIYDKTRRSICNINTSKSQDYSVINYYKFTEVDDV